MPSKFDNSDRITRSGRKCSMGSEEKVEPERKIKSPRRSLRRVTFSDLQKYSKEEANEIIEIENKQKSRSC